METIREAPGEVISGRLRAYVEPETGTAPRDADSADYAIETIQQVLIT